jgi:hypothetical protein
MPGIVPVGLPVQAPKALGLLSMAHPAGRRFHNKYIISTTRNVLEPAVSGEPWATLQRKSNLPAGESSLRPSRYSATRTANGIGETFATGTTGRVKRSAGLLAVPNNFGISLLWSGSRTRPSKNRREGDHLAREIALLLCLLIVSRFRPLAACFMRLCSHTETSQARVEECAAPCTPA